MPAELTDQIAWAAVILTSLLAALTDFRSQRIPNWLVYPSMASGLLFAGMTAGLSGLTSSLVGLLIGGSVFLVLFLAGAGGGGDVKLFAAIGAWLLASRALEICVYTLFAALLIALVRLTWHGKLAQTLKRSLWLFANIFLPKSKKKDLQTDAFELELLGPSTFIGVLVAAWLHFNGY